MKYILIDIFIDNDGLGVLFNFSNLPLPTDWMLKLFVGL